MSAVGRGKGLVRMGKGEYAVGLVLSGTINVNACNGKE
jgi:hypothetical protein